MVFILYSYPRFIQAEQQLLGKKKTKEVVAHIELMRDNLTMTAQRVLELGARLDCKHAQENIDDGVHAFCYKGLCSSSMTMTACQLNRMKLRTV